MALIDYPDQWDAIQIVESAMSRVWDEVLAVIEPDRDSRREVIPQSSVEVVFATPQYAMLRRVSQRLWESYNAVAA